MAISIIRLGTGRRKKDLRLGTVRRPPRGVKKSDFSRLDYYDVWLPILSPSAELIKVAHIDWKSFTKKFKAELNAPDTQHTLDLLAALSHTTEMSLGCYCEDETHCHRSILRELLNERGAKIRD